MAFSVFFVNYVRGQRIVHKKEKLNRFEVNKEKGKRGARPKYKITAESLNSEDEV